MILVDVLLLKDPIRVLEKSRIRNTGIDGFILCFLPTQRTHYEA